MMRSQRKKKQQNKWPKLSAEALNIAAYWRQALCQGERAEISVREMMAHGLETALADMERGRFTAHAVRVLGEKEQHRLRARSRAAGAGDSGSIEEVRVLLCPVRFAKRDRVAGPRTVEVLWVPARMLQSGELKPPVFGGPWIPRALLEPMISDDAVTVGSLDELESFAARHQLNDSASWRDYWAYCEKLIRAVAGFGISNAVLEGYEREKTGYAVLDVTASGASSSLARVFEDVEANRRHPGLFLHFSARKEPARCDYSLAKRVLARSAVRHLGQFGSKFALAPSQRLAVHRFMETPPGDFLCVTGPPGTGKTTMLQSIIASLWVQAASAGAHPPVIVCTAASNQAVTNIIDSLEKGGMEQDVLSQRWLPGVHSFGTFCSSAGRAKENAAYQLELRNGSGLSAEMTRAEYLRKAKESFLASFASWRGEQSSLAKAVKILRAELQRERSALHRDIMLAANGTLLEWLRSLVGLQQRRSWMDLFEVLPKFDQTRRHRMFLLAAHYWEGRWLAETQRELSRKRRKDADNVRFSGETAVWRRRAMITPAFVSTLSMVPRFFAARDNRDEPPIDVLIFDEAGQIPVEAGVACSCLAKRAVIVGDCEQLEPVWNVPPHIDRADALRCGVLRKNDETEWGSLVRRGISASCGSFMYLGLRSTKWTERSTYGVFLSEHRRSVPQIVGFANALAYRGRLEPLRPDLPSRILPPFGYVHVPGTCQQHGESRYNRREAETIASWLLREERRLCDFYRKPDLSGLVAVITPFAAQTRRLEAKLWPRWPKLVVGTVNSLQGAERPVVLFSAVYDRTFRGRYFFDRGRNMLNVAVSRAQDTFIVFADMEIFNPEGQAPSSVLAQWLYSNPAYELTEVEVPPREDMPAEETTRIATLAGHQEVLSGAFEGAKREVLISSPTISSAAIVKDNITALIQAARQRGVSVRVFTDADLDAPNGELKPNAAKGRALLAEAGAEVIVVKAIHNKALAVDDHTLVEGSFNWLSAVRTEGSVHQKLEVSWCYRGPKAREAIILLRDELEHRAGLLV